MRLRALFFASVVAALPMPAVASNGAVHLTVGQLTLGPVAQLPASPAPFQLTAPRLGSTAPVVRLTSASAPAGSARSFVVPAGPSPAAVRATQLANAMYIGDTWSFRGGRELSLHLTPNQGHCAPLMRLTF